MKTISLYEAKAKLSALIAGVAQGDSYVISKNGTPVAELSPYKTRGKRVFGKFKNEIKLLPGWDAPLSEEELAAWEGKE